MSISNPIIREIEKDYEQLFDIVKTSVREAFPEDYFPEDEIGYLVLYFAVSLDNITKKPFGSWLSVPAAWVLPKCWPAGWKEKYRKFM